MLRRSVITSMVLGLGGWSGAALALGGNDTNTSTKINQATQMCQAEIAKRGAGYAAKAAKAMNDCLDAIVKCDEQADTATALACRRRLLVAGAGKCAVGKVDEGASMLGSGAALHAQTLAASRAALLKEMRFYSSMLQRKCFDAAGVDLGSVSIGLGFSPTPGTSLALADATNQDPGGVQCLANGLVLKTHPLADDMTDLIETLHETCVASSNALELGTTCTLDTDCGADGKCGALAKVFRQGSIKPCAAAAALPLVCGDGISVEPEVCDDGNLLNGDGCSSVCAIEPPAASGPLLSETGQTMCWDPADTTVPIATIPCAGSGQDGQVLFGMPPAFVDNGDGTITDTNTGLMWEKLSDDGTIHDWDNFYTWANAFALKIATLNSGGGFAGHTDWRLPNLKELQSIANYQSVNPAVSALFDTGCVPGATVLTGSCTRSLYYWSSSTYVFDPTHAWYLDCSDGDVYAVNKTLLNLVRAVRGGL